MEIYRQARIGGSPTSQSWQCSPDQVDIIEQQKDKENDDDDIGDECHEDDDKMIAIMVQLCCFQC